MLLLERWARKHTHMTLRPVAAEVASMAAFAQTSRSAACAYRQTASQGAERVGGVSTAWWRSVDGADGLACRGNGASDLVCDY